ncbi:carbohydrate ABC transporter permease [Fundicoccus ignavus]|uniref:ABC transporter permease subunit n=1 Tax=Fundicoccus ignavus TaxID=2664442 RepID=A0A6I2GF41_9LACT|nr:carbohydrate ABC transporter permease [Fundicoccus ignavus]MRI80978.1 ABC transporter permease subunit [Fundicoccus ignavus]MRI86467.1 ABC transporter permease subunit [Fundicoccus ignavus]MRJ47745.1 ABC transporter permease subunit [Fundicoccus ignavus]
MTQELPFELEKVPILDELLEEQERLFKQAQLRKRIMKIGLLVVNSILAVVTLFPLIYAVTMSLKTPGEIYTTEFQLLPAVPQFSNYVNAFQTAPLGRFILNSFIVAIAITIGQLLSGALAAFSFEFLNSRFKEVIFALVLATMMVPGEATIVSNYLQVAGWGWLDSYHVLIIPYLTSASTIFLLRQFYKSFPFTLYEAARIDGCSNIRFVFTILLPLSKPALGATAVNAFINAWNMYMWPLMVSGSDNYRTVQIGVSMMQSVDSQSIVLMFAGVVFCLLPSLIIFLVGQKALVKGLFSGSVKG